MSASRAELIGLLPRGGRIAEVGTDRGHFARLILDTCDPAELHLIDLDLSLLDRAVAKDHRVALHGGMSHLVLEGFPEAYFDWIYIDGDHSYAGVTRDADAAASRVKPGGFLVFNDFAHIDPFLGAYGVHRAVVQFAVTRGWSFAWFAYEPSALYDVALRRPANSD
jgi:predicted O-methyltransferase YrrM